MNARFRLEPAMAKSYSNHKHGPQMIVLSKTRNPGEELSEYQDHQRHHYRVNKHTKPMKNAEASTSASLYGSKFP